MPSYDDGQYFMYKYNGKLNKGTLRREKDFSNFVSTKRGDLASSQALTKHAQQRMSERGVSMKDAVKATKKSGAVFSEDRRKIITFVPEAWAAQQGKTLSQSASKPKGPRGPPPAADTLPEGQVRIDIMLCQENVMGSVLGAKHLNIKQYVTTNRGVPTVFYHVDGNDTIIVWGPQKQVARLRDGIRILEHAAIRRDLEYKSASLVPQEKDLPQGHIHKNIHVQPAVRGVLIGKQGKNLAKLRGDYPGATIHFDSENGELDVWGEPRPVEEIYSYAIKLEDRMKKSKFK